MASSAMEHVTEIRRTKFSIGGERNPLTEDLHQAVKNLSAELYAKDVHFLMELIQNAEDNEYPEEFDPSLEFVITSKDITKTGARATLLVFNNEKGFSPKNIDSICSVGRSTKKGLRKHHYIGEKGIGFKSVFLITSQPYIFSNGYQIRFNEKPCQHCNVGYIVPEWVEDNSILSSIKGVYGSSTALPNTILVLPLKREKVKLVKDQLSSIEPEVLLFLSKIKRLSVREANEDPSRNTINAISISSEKNFVTSKSIDADSYTIYLTADEISDDVDKDCGYYMWKQRFPVKQKNKVDVRREVDEWVVTLAFPIGERLKRGKNMPGIYSFLPTETVTSFPFIIQADFLLASSRENILWDNKWNQGILDCIPVAFVNAFISLVKSTENAPVSSLPNMFRFLPIEYSSYPKINYVRDAIKSKVMNCTIVPCESNTGKKLFRKPDEVGRLKRGFWNILNKAKSQGVSFSNISSYGAYLLTWSFHKKEYIDILKYLEIGFVDNEWYAKCIADSNLVMGISEDVYINLLVFIARDWWYPFSNTDMKNIPIIKYVRQDGTVDLCKINVGGNKLQLAKDDKYVNWLIKWNKEFQSTTGKFFLPEVTQVAIRLCPNKDKHILMSWLRDAVKVKFVNVCEYAKDLIPSINNDRNLVYTYAHFLFNSVLTNYLSKHEVINLCSNMPVVDNYGRVTTVKTKGVLVPAYGSEWVELFVSNPWKPDNFVELGEDYTTLVSFFKTYVGASDVPNLSPPNAAIPIMCSPLSKYNTFLLLKWLFNLKLKKVDLPERFLSSIKNGSWLKISLSGSPCYRPPSESFMLESSIENLLQSGSVLVDIPLMDINFYGDEIKQYKEELQTIGVRFENKDACEYIGKRLMSLAASSDRTRDNAFSILKFIRYLEENYLSSKDFINSVREGEWLRTTKGDYRSPNECILYSADWESITPISLLPFIDDTDKFYGSEIHDYKVELKQLGVITDFKDGAGFVVAGIFLPQDCSTITPVNVFALLDSVKKPIEDKVEIPFEFFEILYMKRWIKTCFGYKHPDECLLFNSNWDPYLKRNDGPFIDEDFYGCKIESYEKELNVLGVITDVNEGCHLLASYLNFNSNFEIIGRIYNYLSEVKWKPNDESYKKIWIPAGTENGEWADPRDCVLHDKNYLFSDQLKVLDKLKYERKILEFFANAFNVKVHPSVEDYCNLWKKWESSERKITHTECCAFWEFVVSHWNSNTEEIFKTNLSKMPVLDPTYYGILLIDKCDVFIGDDLFLMDLFQTSSRPIFVWYPQPSLKYLTRTMLLGIYTKLGVRTLSESLQRNICDVSHGKFEPVNSRENIIKKGLLKLILGFLADPKLKFEAERRHEAVNRILAVEAFETAEPMTVKYSLCFSSGEVINVEAKKIIRWDKHNSKFFMQKMKRSRTHKNVMEYASHFAEVIADGVLWENEELVPQLCELIRSGFLVEFDEEAVELLMKIKNLQIFLEDQEYLSCTFSSDRSRPDRFGRMYKRRCK